MSNDIVVKLVNFDMMVMPKTIRLKIDKQELNESVKKSEEEYHVKSQET